MGRDHHRADRRHRARHRPHGLAQLGRLHDWNPRQEKPATAWEAEIDRIFEAVAREVDRDKRRALYHRWQEIVAEQVPLMYFTNPKTQPAVRNTLGNTRLGLQGATGQLVTRYYRTGR